MGKPIGGPSRSGRGGCEGRNVSPAGLPARSCAGRPTCRCQSPIPQTLTTCTIHPRRELIRIGIVEIALAGC